MYARSKLRYPVPVGSPGQPYDAPRTGLEKGRLVFPRRAEGYFAQEAQRPLELLRQGMLIQSPEPQVLGYVERLKRRLVFTEPVLKRRVFGRSAKLDLKRKLAILPTELPFYYKGEQPAYVPDMVAFAEVPVMPMDQSPVTTGRSAAGFLESSLSQIWRGPRAATWAKAAFGPAARAGQVRPGAPPGRAISIRVGRGAPGVAPRPGVPAKAYRMPKARMEWAKPETGLPRKARLKVRGFRTTGAAMARQAAAPLPTAPSPLPTESAEARKARIESLTARGIRIWRPT